jgi:hypothetical protein
LAGDTTILLTVTGEPGTSVRGTCELTTSRGGEAVEVAGELPLERMFAGVALRCRLEAVGGRVEVELVKGGSASRSSTGLGGTASVGVG